MQQQEAIEGEPADTAQVGSTDVMVQHTHVVYDGVAERLRMRRHQRQLHHLHVDHHRVVRLLRQRLHALLCILGRRAAARAQALEDPARVYLQRHGLGVHALEAQPRVRPEFCLAHGS